ncbi:hypothetical protein JVT61DRAFT_5140 [Boletus reticuloceps]|uniref:Uncharacterized protein n=1 Tax=Boletus reticuloceps TaxID=495285 RepID=A0A8I2YZZ9_9AGAM|nr:hypothetical protein JVT61DRAFT_5140 [Boletus reticuloceps]
MTEFIVQGVQMIQDTSTFGGFSNSLLCAFREEHPKATIMTFACLSSMSPLHANIGDVSYLIQLMYTPVQSLWTKVLSGKASSQRHPFIAKHRRVLRSDHSDFAPASMGKELLVSET